MKLDPASLSPGFLRALPESEREKLGLGGISKELAAKKWKAGQERELQGLIRNWLNLHGYPIGGGRADKRTRRTIGEPDFTVCIDGGRYLAIECKAEGASFRPEQAEFAAKVMAKGGAVCLAHALNDVRDCIKELLSP